MFNLLNIYSELYWITRLDGIISFCTIVSVLAIIITGIYLIVLAVNSGDLFEDEHVSIKKNFGFIPKLCIPLGIIFSLAAIFIPSKRDYIFIVAGGKTINWIKQDSSLNKIPGKTTEIIYEFLDKQIKELKSSK